MTLRVALLRGVDAGGAGRLPMAAFREPPGALHLRDAATHIQSGNAVFRAAFRAAGTAGGEATASTARAATL